MSICQSGTDCNQKKRATEGYKVCINYLNNHVAANVTVNLIHKNGGHAIAVQADVSKESEIEKLFNIVDKELG